MKILLLTNEYPNEMYPKQDSPWVVPYFARAWVRQGHEVQVIVNSTKFPTLYYSIGSVLFASYFTKKYSVNVKSITAGVWTKEFKFEDNGVQVKNIPMLKFFPSGAFPNHVLKNQKKKIVDYLQKNDFKPDVITGHWLNPQLLLISALKEVYGCRTAFVFHSDYDAERLQRFNVTSFIQGIDKLGCRSVCAAKILQDNLQLPYQPFVCSSGVPDDYVRQSIAQGDHAFSDGDLSLLTVGRLVPVKKYDKLIEAIHLLKGVPISLNIVGDGPMADSLQSQIEKYDLCDSIHLVGKLSRNQVQKKMRSSDVFVLIGMEVFGLVYIEAMMQGCIVIGTRGGGIDGIIVDNENGFLCKHGDAEQLVDIILKIKDMSIEEKQRISKNAINTAKKYSDSSVAERYLNDILN